MSPRTLRTVDLIGCHPPKMVVYFKPKKEDQPAGGADVATPVGAMYAPAALALCQPSISMPE